jgi:hypothetical protein
MCACAFHLDHHHHHQNCLGLLVEFFGHTFIQPIQLVHVTCSFCSGMPKHPRVILFPNLTCKYTRIGKEVGDAQRNGHAPCTPATPRTQAECRGADAPELSTLVRSVSQGTYLPACLPTLMPTCMHVCLGEHLCVHVHLDVIISTCNCNCNCMCMSSNLLLQDMACRGRTSRGCPRNLPEKDKKDEITRAYTPAARRFEYLDTFNRVHT